MASTPVEFRCPSGLTLTLSLFPYGSDTIANTGGDAATEATNCKGRYSATVTEAISGWHDVMIRDGSSNLIATGSVYMEDDTSIKRVHDAADRIWPVEDGAIPTNAADAAGGLPISDAGGLDMDAILSRMGTPANLGGGATLAANLSDIESQTDDIGVAGAGLTEAGGTGDQFTAIPWNAAWDAEVQSEVEDGLAVYDPPTNAEMVARTLAAAAYATATAQTTAQNDLDILTGSDGVTLATSQPNYAPSTVAALAALAGKFTGITLLAEWLGLIAGKQVGNTTARTELRATGAGSGTYDETTDALQAIRDRGDAAWTTGAGGGTTVVVTPTVGVVTPDTTSTEIHCKVGATNARTVAVLDGNDDPVDLTTMQPLQLVIETLRGVDVQVVADASITIGGADDNQFTFTPSAATVSVERTLKWSLRRTTNGQVLLDGPLIVDYSPLEDA